MVPPTYFSQLCIVHIDLLTVCIGSRKRCSRKLSVSYLKYHHHPPGKVDNLWGNGFSHKIRWTKTVKLVKLNLPGKLRWSVLDPCRNVQAHGICTRIIERVSNRLTTIFVGSIGL